MIGDRHGDYESEKMAWSTDSSVDPILHPHLPPGFRFHPTDEELVVHYLKRKVSSLPLAVSIIAELDIYKFDPWELPAKATYGEHEWYFFSPRERKYPNGARPNRAALSGYWKATGTDKPVMSSTRNQKVGVKKALVFYGGKPPKGTKTSWIMHEYRLLSNKPFGIDFGNKKNSLRLDEWVLCRIYRKNDFRRSPLDQDRDSSVDDMLEQIPSSLTVSRHDLQGVSWNSADQMRPSYGPLFDDSHHELNEGMITNFPLLSPAIKLETGTLQPLPGDPSCHLVPIKRQIPSTLYYSEEKDHDHPAEAFETLLERNTPLYMQDTGNVCNDQGTGIDSSTGEGSNGIVASLLSQMQPNSSVFTSLDSNGGSRPLDHLLCSGLNWYAS